MPSKPENNSLPPQAADTRHLYEYSVVQYSPRVERGESVNVGLVMMCKRRRWVKARVLVDEALLQALAPGCDTEALRRQLSSFERIAAGDADSPVAALEAHERFRWLTAVRSACITTTRPHPGHTPDLDRAFDTLFAELVER